MSRRISSYFEQNSTWSFALDFAASWEFEMSWSARTQQPGFQVGDIVVYRRKSLKQVGLCSRDLQRASGRVKSLGLIDGSYFAEIEWDHPGIPERVNATNLCRTSDWALDL
jgi:hypothetical protein